MMGRQKPDKICWGKGAISIALLLTACSQPQASTTTQPSAPETKDTQQVTQVNLNETSEESEENIGIQRVTPESPKPTSNQKHTNQGIVLPEVRPVDLSGNLSIAGSATLFLLNNTIADHFVQAGYPGDIKIAGIGTASAFELFCQQGKLDIVSAYRPIKPAEIAACQANGREPVGFKIGIDGWALIVSSQNDFLVSSQNDFLPEELSREEVTQLFTAQKWSDVNPSWPNVDIVRFAPATERAGGLFDRFVDVFLDGDAQKLTNAPNTVIYQRSDQIYNEALTNPYVIGFLGHAYYQQNKEAFKKIRISGMSSDEKELFAWPAYLYSDTQLIRERPEVGAFINYYLTHVKEEIKEAGYFPPSSAALEESKTKLLQVQGEELPKDNATSAGDS